MEYDDANNFSSCLLCSSVYCPRAGFRLTNQVETYVDRESKVKYNGYGLSLSYSYKRLSLSLNFVKCLFALHPCFRPYPAKLSPTQQGKGWGDLIKLSFLPEKYDAISARFTFAF